WQMIVLDSELAYGHADIVDDLFIESLRFYLDLVSSRLQQRELVRTVRVRLNGSDRSPIRAFDGDRGSGNNGTGRVGNRSLQGSGSDVNLTGCLQGQHQNKQRGQDAKYSPTHC